MQEKGQNRLERKTIIGSKNELKVKTGIISKIDEIRLRWFGRILRVGENKLLRITLY